MNNVKSVPVITLDGPSGTGKGTVGQLVAAQLCWHYLDSGAIYRVFALQAHAENIKPTEIERLKTLGSRLDIRFTSAENLVGVYCNGENFSSIIRDESTGELASMYACVPAVRQSVLSLQKQQRQLPGLVADGRDMGSSVFIDAPYKFYLDASVAVRVERRYKQLKEKGFNGSLASLREEMLIRDARDANRETDPMVIANDATEIDTSNLTIFEVVDRIINIVRNSEG